MTTVYPPQNLERRERRRLLERAPGGQLSSLRLTQRDLAVIQAVYEYRALTSAQIEELLFGGQKGKETRCRKRLRRLYDHGYLWRDEQPTKLSQGRAPLVYRLDTKGADLLTDLWGQERDALDWHPREKTISDPFMNHLLRTNDVRVAITRAAAKNGFRIEEWRDDRTLRSRHWKDEVVIKDKQGREEKTAIVPDGYFVLRTVEYDFHYFLEVDLRTVVGQASRWGRRDWNRKVKAYLAYYDSGQYQERYGAETGRVLTVTTGEWRLKNLKKITEDAGGRKRFWFTTFERLNTDSVLTKPIWHVATKRGLHTLT
jgi:hypothetical protein